jgi:hypothetical protein
MYVAFSPWGFVAEAREKAIDYGFVAGGIVMAAVIFGIPLRQRRRDRGNPATNNQPSLAAPSARAR